MTTDERKNLEETLNTCNKCKHLNFALKRCEKNKKNPIKLNTFTNANGFIHCLKPASCEV